MDKRTEDKIQAVLDFMSAKLKSMGARSHLIFVDIDGMPFVSGKTSRAAERLLMDIMLKRAGNKATLVSLPLSEESYKKFVKLIDSGQPNKIFEKIMKSDGPVTSKQVDQFLKAIADDIE